MWGEPFYLSGMAMNEELQLVELGYEFRECQLCGMPVSEEMQPVHENYHQQ